MIYFVSLQGENFTESTSDFILENHCFESESSIDSIIYVGCSNNDWIEIIMSELTSLSLGIISITEDCTIWIPLSDSWGVGDNSLLNWDELTATKNFSMLEFSILIECKFESFISQDMRSISSKRKSRESTNSGIGVE